ncbi:hypothetical protein [Rhizobium rhizogenes]|uniref:hypothetical protein n=1 Tax=Rhizobium rhizogenes TaxID=359 RepID=UPI0024BE2982|nr:hypothetical protein [Rhizobium rhizogenes]MDJ1637436.1 hypothetical protein [Rhizobium rhizogenes]
MIRAFKSSSNSTEIINLDRDAIRENHRNGRQTNIMFDTNILIAIESAYKTGQRHQELKNAGVLELARLIEKTSRYGVFISPAAAYQELPPARRGDVEAAFDRFLADYLPNFREDPNSMKVPYAGGKMDPEHFSALSLERQKAISCSYASLLAINVIHRLEALNGLEKFALYIDYCAEVLDLISLKELTIARYVFAPENGLTEQLRTRKVAITNNFVKLKKGGGKGLTPDKVLERIALNGANDLKLIAAADIVNNSREQFNFGIIEHDVWIATSDDKLYEFCCACPGYMRRERGGPLARYVETHTDIKGTRYWRDSIEIQQRRLEERYFAVDREREMDSIVQSAFDIEADLLNGKADDYFRLRSWRSPRVMHN